MDTPATIMNFKHDSIDTIGQTSSLSIYTQICLCYSLPDTSLQNTVVDTLKKGLERLTKSFPWVAARVVKEDAGDKSDGVYKMKPLDRVPRLVVKDLTNDPSAPTMDALRKANFPFRMLDESIIAPRNTIPGTSGEPAYDETPVFLLQATFIQGGLILTFNGQHQTMDMTGQGQIIDLLSKACRNEAFTSEEVQSGNLPRRDIIPLLNDSYKQGPELADQIVKPPSFSPNSDNPALPQQPVKSSWAYFIFSGSSLTKLKALATASLPSSASFVSTDDTLTAFIWQSIMRARLPRLDPATTASFARAVDVRRYLNVPATYPGIIQNMAYHKIPLEELVESPLGIIAAELRAAVDPEKSDIAYRTQALVTVLDRAPETQVSMTAAIDLTKDLMLSSWAKIDCYQLDFGFGLGPPEAVRRPQFIPFESLLYLMPRKDDGEIAAALCLRDDDMERLIADELVSEYATYVN